MARLSMGGLLLSMMFTTSMAAAAGTAEVNMDVEAQIHSSVHTEWQKINSDDERYQLMAENLKGNKAVGWRKDEWLLLPYGLYLQLRTNDENRMVSLHVDNLVSLDSKIVIPIEQLYVSVDGGELHSVKSDLPLLHPEERGEHKESILLFVLKSKLTNRSGSYAANFKLITNALP